MNEIRQTKMNSTRQGRGGSIFAPEPTMAAEVWDFVPGQVSREPRLAQRWQAPEHSFRCYRETLEVSRCADTLSNQAENQRSSVLMGVLLGLTMFVAVLISGDFGDSDWSSTQNSNAEFALSRESASVPQR